MASVSETCGSCCSPFGDGGHLIETKSVTLASDDITALYPFQNTGCGGCSDPQPNCENKYWYFKEKHTTCDNVTVKGPEAGDPTFNKGCDKTEKVKPSSSSIKYFSCTCEGVQTGCSEVCESGDRRASEKLSEFANTETEVTGGENCDCVGIGEDGCEGAPEGWLQLQKEILTKDSCEFSAPYYAGGCDPEDIGNLDCYQFAKTKVKYSDGIDIRDPASSSFLSDFSSESYPNEWHEACTSWGGSAGNEGSEKTVTSIGIKTYNPEEGNCPSFVSKSFTLDPKYKIRWRLQIPSSCYIKIWVAKWEYTSVPASDPQNPPTITLTKDSLDASVVSVPNSNGFCFNNDTECSTKSLWNVVSKEFELNTADILAYQDENPTAETGSLQKTTTAGVAIVGISYVENWDPPLFKYDPNVWECRVQSQESSCPYYYGFIAQTCWGISDEQVDDLQKLFEENLNIVTCDAP